MKANLALHVHIGRFDHQEVVAAVRALERGLLQKPAPQSCNVPLACAQKVNAAILEVSDRQGPHAVVAGVIGDEEEVRGAGISGGAAAVHKAHLHHVRHRLAAMVVTPIVALIRCCECLPAVWLA